MERDVAPLALMTGAPPPTAVLLESIVRQTVVFVCVSRTNTSGSTPESLHPGGEIVRLALKDDIPPVIAHGRRDRLARIIAPRSHCPPAWR